VSTIIDPVGGSMSSARATTAPSYLRLSRRGHLIVRAGPVETLAPAVLSPFGRESDEPNRLKPVDN
jgi:hypothetical protein